MQGRRLRKPVNQVENHLKNWSASLQLKSRKKTVANESEMKTSHELSIEDEMRGRTNKLTEDVNTKPDSPKVVPCKEKEEVVSRQIPSAPVQEAIKE